MEAAGRYVRTTVRGETTTCLLLALRLRSLSTEATWRGRGKRAWLRRNPHRSSAEGDAAAARHVVRCRVPACGHSAVLGSRVPAPAVCALQGEALGLSG